MRRNRTLFLVALLVLASLAVAQQPPPTDPSEPTDRATSSQERTTPGADVIGPVLPEEISDDAVWSEDATSNKADEGFIPSEAISADAAIAFPVDI